METVTVVLFWLAATLYAAACGLYIYFFATKSRRASIAGRIATGLGFISHTIALVLRWVAIGSLPNSYAAAPLVGTFNSLVLIAWCLALAYFVVEHLIRIRTLGIVTLPIAVFLMVWAGLVYTSPNVLPLTAPEVVKLLALKSRVVYAHLASVFTAYSAFTLAATAGVLYLLQERQLKKKKVGAFFMRLPPLDVLDRLELRAVSFGIPFITLGLLLGIVRALQLASSNVGFAANWYADPLVMLAIFTWLFYVVYLLLRHYAGWEGRRSAWLAIVGLALVSGLRLIASAGWAIFHSYGR